MDLLRGTLGLVGLLLLTLVLCSCNGYDASGQEVPCSGCNLVIISINTLRADRVGVYGYSLNTTPYIDRFAKNSIVFENAYSLDTFTLPSATTLFTSTYPQYHGVTEWYLGMSDELPVLTEVLASAGYTTVGIAGDEALSPVYGFNRGFRRYYFAPENTTIVFSEIRKLRDKKFFLYIQLEHLHGLALEERDKYFMDAKCEDLQQIKLWYAYDRYKEEGGKAHIFDFYLNYSNTSYETKMHTINAFYDGKLKVVDEQFGGIIEALKDLNLLKNTIVVVTSDHGQALYEHDFVGHGGPFAYEELVHVPLIMYIPGQKASKLSSYIQTIDIAPTVLDLLGIDIPREFQGKSFNDCLLYNFSCPSRCIYGKNYIICDGWKLIYVSNETNYLYNLKEDPKESTNLAPILTNLTSSLKSRFIKHKAFLKSEGPPEPKIIKIPPNIKTSLIKQGYWNK